MLSLDCLGGSNPDDQYLYKRESEGNQTDSGGDPKTRACGMAQKDLETPEAGRDEEWNTVRFQKWALSNPDFWPLEP